LKNEERKEVFRSVFNSPSGRIVMKEILTHCRVDAEAFHVESDRVTCVNLGMQRAGRWIRDQIKEDSE